MTTDTDVLIVGAGPTGLLLAGDLAAAGVTTTVLEKRAGESNITRAFALHARTLEMLDARGLADEVIATGRQVRRPAPVRPPRPGPVRPAEPVPVRPGHAAVQHRTRVAGAGRSSGRTDPARPRGDRAEAGRRRGGGASRRRDVPGPLRRRRGRRAQPGTRRARPGLPGTGDRPVAHAGRRPADRRARRGAVHQRRRRLLRLRGAVRRRLVPGVRLGSPAPPARLRAGRPRRDPRRHPPRPRNRLRHARPPLDVALPLRRAAGHPVPGRPGVPGRRRRARAHAGRWPRDEHRHPGRRQPELEAGRDPAGRRRGQRCWTPTTASGIRSAAWCCAAAAR